MIVILPCFCDCNSKLNAKLSDLIDKIKKKPGIKYDDEEGNEKEKMADMVNQCPCSCHGMYADTKQKSDEKKK